MRQQVRAFRLNVHFLPFWSRQSLFPIGMRQFGCPNSLGFFFSVVVSSNGFWIEMCISATLYVRHWLHSVLPVAEGRCHQIQDNFHHVF
ncbi:hypothetical protein QQF64_005074 [Cirrhinus molitorella]|uniref:Uncharacterized protein n=1 Tax=Cirrhinus molitorella TaxID=172907 RepID=A0ABR3MKC9_9TELE